MEADETIVENSVKSKHVYFIRGLCVFLIIFAISSYHIRKNRLLTLELFMRNDYSDSARYRMLINNDSYLTALRKLEIRCVVFTKGNGGRLGNVMFLVAGAYGLARLHACHLYIVPEFTKQARDSFIFDLSPQLISTSEFTRYVQNRTSPKTNVTRSCSCDYFPELVRPNAIPPGTIYELTDYWGSYLYFEKYSDDIRRLFYGKPSVLKNVVGLFVDIYMKKFRQRLKLSMESHQQVKRQLAESNRITWIGIHIRRSDFITLNLSSSAKYIFDSMAYYASRYSNIQYIVASDDKDYCINIFRDWPNVVVTPSSFSPGEDLVTLSLCQHSIVTGGTYSWWAGFLAGGQVIHDSVLGVPCVRREHYFPPWFLMDENARASRNRN